MFSQTSGGMPTGLHRPSGQASSEKAGNGLSVWTGPKTWPGIRKSNDLWPMSEPCCDRFHSSSPTLPTNKCPAESHRSSRGCFLAVPSRVSEAQCLEAPGGGGGRQALSRALAFENAILCVVSVEGCGGLPGPGGRTSTDGQMDFHDAAFWCHPHATYASSRGYDFLEIAFSESFTAVTMATQYQLLRTDFRTQTSIGTF